MGRGLWRAALVTVAALLLAVVSVHGLRRPSGSRAGGIESVTVQDRGDAFVYGFDRDIEAFVFTFTLPSDGATPRDVTTVSDAGQLDVWFTETGADRIGRLTFTSTTDYAYRPYTVSRGSKPLNLIVADGNVWFTAAAGDYIGRLDPDTGDVDAFSVAAGSYPADLTVGGNGNIWFTQMMADQLAELVVTSTVDYTVNVYTDAFLAAGRPYGIAATGRSIYVAQTANDLISVFTPPNSWVHMPGSGFPITLGEPHALAVDNRGTVWGTERAGDAVSRLEFGTFPMITRYALSPSGGEPMGITVDPNNTIWFAQRSAGQIGRLDPSLPAAERTSYYALPLSAASPTGIAADGEGGIWVVASRPHRIHLPLVLRGRAQ